LKKGGKLGKKHHTDRVLNRSLKIKMGGRNAEPTSHKKKKEKSH